MNRVLQFYVALGRTAFQLITRAYNRRRPSSQAVAANVIPRGSQGLALANGGGCGLLKSALLTRQPALWLGMALLALPLPSLLAQPAKPDIQYSLKAVFLFNFSQFVEWPAQAFTTPSMPITIALLGGDPFGPALEEAIREETVNNRKLVVKRIKSLDEAKACHILFLTKTGSEHQPTLAASLKGLPVLTVSEADKFCQQGGMINFYMQDNKVKFEANPDAAEQAGLKLSSKLLKLARVVKTEMKGTGKP